MTTRLIGHLSDFADSSVRRVDIRDDDDVEHAVAVIRIGDAFYAIGDRCSHANVSLAEGTLWADECELECPKHGSAFSLLSGEPQSFPATRPVPVHSIDVRGNDVYLTLTLTTSGPTTC